MERKCKKGFILIPSETDGQYVPFFIQVRDKDIIWDEESYPNGLESILESIPTSELQIRNPSSEWIFDIKNWKVHLYSDKTFVAAQKLDIKKYSTSVSEKVVEIRLTLPFIIKNDNSFSIMYGKAFRNIDLERCSINTIISTDYKISEVIIKLNATDFPFKIDLKNNPDYKNNYLFITMSGTIYIE